MVVVLGHWMEHFLQTFQIYVLGWPVPQARGMIGLAFPVARDAPRSSTTATRW